MMSQTHTYPQQSVDTASCGCLARQAALRGLVLVGLWGCLFWPDLSRIWMTALHDKEWAHTLVCPLAVVLLLLRRGNELAVSSTRGSVMGIVVVLLGLLAYAASIWPLAYGYLRDLTPIVVLAGVILVAAGWRVLKRCLPVLLLIIISTPLSSRTYVNLTLPIDRETSRLMALCLGALPDLSFQIVGDSLTFTRAGSAGSIALGEFHPGCSMLLVPLVVGLVVVFSRVRPWWQVLIVSVATGPILLFCNFLRLLTHSVLTIYVQPDPTARSPQYVSALVLIAAGYACFSIACRFAERLLVEDLPEEDCLAEEQRSL